MQQVWENLLWTFWKKKNEQQAKFTDMLFFTKSLQMHKKFPELICVVKCKKYYTQCMIENHDIKSHVKKEKKKSLLWKVHGAIFFFFSVYENIWYHFLNFHLAPLIALWSWWNSFFALQLVSFCFFFFSSFKFISLENLFKLICQGFKYNENITKKENGMFQKYLWHVPKITGYLLVGHAKGSLLYMISF